MDGKATVDMCERGGREGQGRASAPILLIFSHTALLVNGIFVFLSFIFLFFSNGICHEMDEEKSGMKDRREEGRDPGFL